MPKYRKKPEGDIWDWCGMKQVTIKEIDMGSYVLRHHKDYQKDGGSALKMVSAFSPSGVYIGDEDDAKFLCEERGIEPIEASINAGICSIGFSKKEHKWYGWSHRAICGFGIGDVVKNGDACASSGWSSEYLSKHPEADLSLPVGFEAKTLDDAKRMAIAFAESVS